MTALFDREKALFNMIEQQIRPWKVLNQKVLDVFNRIPRDHFVDDSMKDIAFMETRIPLQNQDKMLFPALEGRILQEVSLKPTDHVLVIGTGSGFLSTCAAVLSDNVFSIDTNNTYTELATTRAHLLDVKNLLFKTIDLKDFSPEESYFDVIILTGSCIGVPEKLIKALKEGGRLLAFIGKQNHPITSAILHEKICGQIRTSSLFEVELERLHGFEDQPSFIF